MIFILGSLFCLYRRGLKNWLWILVTFNSTVLHILSCVVRLSALSTACRLSKCMLLMLAEKGTQPALLIYLSSAPLSQVGQLLKGYEVFKSISWRNTIEADRVKPRPFKHLFSTSNFTSTLLNCFVLEYSAFKTKQLRCTLVKLKS